MKPRFWIFSLAVLILVASIYFSSKRLKHDEPVAMVPPDKPLVVEAPKVEPTAPEEKKPEYVPPSASCKAIPEFSQTKLELGHLVNQHELREHNFTEFLNQVNKFRLKKGLPLPLVVDPAKMGQEKVVYNNCRPSCRGNVNQVFVTRLLGGRNIEVLTQGGNLKVFPVHESGIEAITVDELNGKGIPFKSWLVPVIDSGWYIDGNYLYYPLDIEGVYLQADTRGNWNFVGKPASLKKLEEVEPAVKFAGCTPEDHCFSIEGSAGVKGRHFKAPKACEPVLQHSQDEPVDETPPAAERPTAGGSGPGKAARPDADAKPSPGALAAPAGGNGGEL